VEYKRGRCSSHKFWHIEVNYMAIVVQRENS
jgi:hypothetical protein